MRHSFHPSHQGRLRRGFTLIELVFVLAITGMVFGTAIYMISSPQIEKEIRETHHGIEDLVLRARAMSYSYQQPFVVELRAREVRLRPLASPEAEIVQDLTEEIANNGGALRSLDSMSWPVVFPIDPKYLLSVRRWNSGGFIELEDDDVEYWIHQPNSPCEPMALQLVSEEDQALLSREYHPLTAKAVDLEMAIGNQ
jgi:prepilin-type N-terminal cleavage/methylation domain-containing protein